MTTDDPRAGMQSPPARRTRLSVAIDCRDGITGERVGEEVAVRAPDAALELVENASGYRLALDADRDPLTVVVDGGDRFFDEQVTLFHESEPPGEDGIDATDPGTAVRITLDPRPAYRPDPGATRLRGRITRGPADDPQPVANGRVTAVDVDDEVRARTTATGEYLLVVPVRPAHVVRIDGEEYVDPTRQPNGSSGPPSSNGSSGPPSSNGPSGPPSSSDPDPPELTLSIAAPDGTTETVTTPVPLGRRTVLDHRLS